MKLIKYITALIIGLTFIGSAYAQEQTQHAIEVFLDSVPGIYGNSINFNDFFSHSYVTAKVYADKKGGIEKIRISKCRTTPSGNIDKASAETARKLLIESSKSIIKSHKWQPGKTQCKIVWKPKHNSGIESKPVGREIRDFVAGLVTDETKKRMYKDEGSAFLRLEIDSTGTILAARHIGNIFWGGKTDGGITGVSFTMQRDNSRSSLIFIPRSQPARYMDETELRTYKAGKQLRRNAKQIARELTGKRFGELAGKEKEICIEIGIDTSGTEVEESDPIYPGGAKALKEYYTDNFRYNKILRRNNIKGIVKAEILIKKNGKAKLLHTEVREQAFQYEGCDSWEKIEKEIYDETKRITKNMPRWTPGTFDGKNVETKCSFRFRLEGID